MNHAPRFDAAITALSVLADYLHPGYIADPCRLLTAAEMGCEIHGLPVDQAPAVTAIASEWIALATGRPPALPGRDDAAADRDLAGLPDLRLGASRRPAPGRPDAPRLARLPARRRPGR
jgi:hypothetical protein